MATPKDRHNTYLSKPIGLRLRRTGAVRKQPLTQVLEEALERGLPTFPELDAEEQALLEAADGAQ